MHQGRVLQDGINQLYAVYMGGKNDGFIATGVIEIEDEDIEDSPGNETGIH